MSRPLVSIIIPCFNAAPYVGEAIESALRQTYKPTEVIVVDDGSTDDSLTVIRSFEGRIRWETGPHRGASAARNRGLSLSQGEFIQFLDSDDVLVQNKIEIQVERLIQYGTNWVACGWYYMNQPQQPVRIPAPDTDPLLFVLNHKLPIEAPLHRRTALEQAGGFREDLPCAQEFELHLRLAIHNTPLPFVPQPLFAIRSVPDSVSSNYVRVLEQLAHILPSTYEILRAQNALTPERRRAFATAMARAGRHALQRSRPDLGLRCLSWAEQVDPAGAALAYGRFGRWLRRLAGPSVAERAIVWARKRRISTCPSD